LFDAVEIDGEHFRDGYYMGNPTIYPLIYECSAQDVILVLTTLLGAKPISKTSADILNRIRQNNLQIRLHARNAGDRYRH